MSAYRVHFSNRAHAYTEDEIAVVVDAMRTADPLTQGVHLRRFQERFREYTGAEHAFATSNATVALEIAAELAGLGPGDELIVPSHTFTSSAYPFAKRGVKLVWADIDLDTRVVTAQTLAARIGPRSRALMVPHLYGYVADMPAIAALAQEHGLLLMEDAAQSLGATLDGRHCGTFGDFAIYSFHSHKNVTTLGEGGMLVVRDPRHAELVPMLRHNGHCAFPFEREDYWIPAMGNLELPELDGRHLWPANYCIGEVECALGCKLLERMDRMNAEKRARALRFIDALAEFPQFHFHRVDSPRHSYHLLAARLDEGLRDDFIRAMAREKGVQCVVQYYPLNRYPFYRKLGFGEADCPNADRFFDNMVSFPFHHWLSDGDFKYMLDAAREVMARLVQ